MTDHILAQAERHLPNIPLTVVSQGAEAIVFQTSVHPYNDSSVSQNYIIKYRPPKRYRHPKIDAQITKSRTAGEAKFMHKLLQLGVRSPRLVLVDLPNGIIWMNYLGNSLPNGEVSSFKNYLWYLEKNAADSCLGAEVQAVCTAVGALIATLHLNDMIHGDLTSSNILLEDLQPVLIDFGLSSYSALAEDKAVDLYVLERAILSAHSVYAEEYNQWMLEGYKSAHNPKTAGKLKQTLGRLDEVRLRGRKRSMLG